MEALEYKGKILSDGHISCPDEVKKRLHLTNGSIVKVAISPSKQERITKLKGIWDGIEITDEDIRVARKEMWGKVDTGL
jgi:hypothetical protein